ncbi:glycoside hydrolase family 30 protein [Arabiibacter massiliensis]|uniref:glycoside hydrolase family 30 protein n=1 Tax=Arabiibacter massiliensis TaxID=1870985 RepID=UPI0009B99CEF|nr:glycoside hydrolase family 30 beta sandwich domain-containing protein [Arabiibacter massiliensis]
MRVYTTDGRSAFRRDDVRFRRDERAEMELVVCRPDRTFQRIAGFGGAFTEAGAHVFAQMPPDEQDRFIALCFGNADAGGNAYTLCRTHIQSCDFALGNYAYVRPFDRALRSFSIERDRRLLLPFIQCGLAANPELELLASPWSPPAFMKTNRMMNGGGRLRRSCYEAWARLLARYVAAYAQEGVRIGRMSVQNEPMARQTWDSCLFEPEEEAEFAARFLRPALDDAGFPDVKLLAWDHNTDRVLDRAEAVLAHPGAAEAVDGIAFHWYAGDHFEQVRAVAEAFPGKELLFTEGCVEFSREGMADATQERKAEQYAHALIGHLEAGAQGFIDWNLLLDERGGPNHVGNFCEAPLMYDREAQKLLVNRSFYYLGHVSRFVRPGARRFLTSRFSSDVECAGFVDAAGGRVLVVLNRTGRAVRFDVAERPWTARVEAPAHGIVTCTWTAEELAPALSS